MTKQISIERAMEAINICTKYMTDSMRVYQNRDYPNCIRIVGVTIITTYELKKLTEKKFFAQITKPNIQAEGLEIQIYDWK